MQTSQPFSSPFPLRFPSLGTPVTVPRRGTLRQARPNDGAQVVKHCERNEPRATSNVGRTPLPVRDWDKNVVYVNYVKRYQGRMRTRCKKPQLT